MRIFSIFCMVLLFNGCAMSSLPSETINGVSFVASRDVVDETHTNPVVNVGANYAAIMPFGFLKSLDHPEIVHNTDRQWFGETRVGAKQYIEELRKKNIKIMVKPQIWVWNGEFTGKITMIDDEKWIELEQSYSSFILEYAELAQETNAEILCIGTELENFIKQRPEFWHDLISKIKTVYKGKLTYAANWDEFKRTPFWGELDYIGIDAYFPVSDQKTPTVEDCKAGWQSHKKIIKAIADEHKKPILFTEYGYRSMDYTGKEPWQSDHKIQSLNFEGQSNATEALLDEFWNEEWFAGGFVWKWFHAHDRVGGKEDNQFTPQNKPVEKIIQSFYKTE
ncbi:glycoside hydrolase family 113 [Psychroserpens sp. Hel_I_66]|uniref:glycoside hydrolase family 113 n=1 Tax=Psychroserpens sp. Hel_I_66 TaxID=1250004 RepID=UPI0006457532|nr:glycoside hydrolase [Psychroserpens sp. Hel_I_66]